MNRARYQMSHNKFVSFHKALRGDTTAPVHAPL